MINRLLKTGTVIGMAICVIGYIFLKLLSLSAGYFNIYDITYSLTALMGCLFILTGSRFVKEKIYDVLKIIGLLFVVMLGSSLLNELNVFELSKFHVFYIKILPMLLFTGIYSMYLDYFRKKEDHDKLDYWKIILLTLIIINVYFIHFNFHPSLFKDVNQVLFWIIVTGILLNEYIGSKMGRID
ncbi:hypothetical protein [Salinimicrobium sediminilitoris]|uniref:hypothetical protein n=1 Tax=Salinimicrobium sediminilitoris TaxID=2876715 RepID=UPI001E3A12A4|nr:hypothetical protein [Salinimicrobium sediminilitoris]MCC8360054.1 hypothetical protein [Salinimicrobium sediminilitoris]